MSALSDEQVRIWINACNSEDARETLRELLAYRIGEHAAPLEQRSLVAALRRLMDCSRAIVGADTSDEAAAEAFDMYFEAQKSARTALSAIPLQSRKE